MYESQRKRSCFFTRTAIADMRASKQADLSY